MSEKPKYVMNSVLLRYAQQNKPACTHFGSKWLKLKDLGQSEKVASYEKISENHKLSGQYPVRGKLLSGNRSLNGL